MRKKTRPNTAKDFILETNGIQTVDSGEEWPRAKTTKIIITTTMNGGLTELRRRQRQKQRQRRR